MSDWLQFLVDERVSAGDASRRAEVLRTRLVSEGWIGASADAECVLAATGHRPGARVGSWFGGDDAERDFTRLRTNGVSILAGPFTNLAAGPYDVATLACPRCGRPIDEDALFESVGGWTSGEGDAMMGCDSCSESVPLRALRSPDSRESPVVCGHLALTFFNWPRLDDRGWKRNVVDTVAGVLGVRPSIAWTKL